MTRMWVVSLSVYVAMILFQNPLLFAQGLVAASGSAPVLGVICDAGTEDEVSGVGRAVTSTLSTAARWSFSTEFRWLNSMRDFVGDRDRIAAGLAVDVDQNRGHSVRVHNRVDRFNRPPHLGDVSDTNRNSGRRVLNDDVGELFR